MHSDNFDIIVIIAQLFWKIMQKQEQYLYDKHAIWGKRCHVIPIIFIIFAAETKNS